MSHWRLFYHLVWATRGRASLLTGVEIVRPLEKALESVCRGHRIIIHALGTIPEHVHLAVSIPPSVSISLAVKQMKGSSSHLLNSTVFADGVTEFAWQAEYGVYSFSERSLPDVVAYVRNQPARHAESLIWPDYETTERMYDRSG